MPHVSSSGGGDDLGSEDEVKVFKDEGEDEKRSSENLTEEKSSLIDLTESQDKSAQNAESYATTDKTSARTDLSPVFGKVDPTPHTSSFNMGYLVSSYPYPNGAGGPIPVSMVSVYHFIVSRIVLPGRGKSTRTVEPSIRGTSTVSKVLQTFLSPRIVY
ncbi:unnamed protein product [Xylocopa violacea]|uniref:CTNNB1 binding N-teminal domain-containing protein n=1 Tax=Xylocopa violacea TaxID=135666 RepID=A0ABP1MZL7_XYLVO